jgi:hypothetical protein
MIIVLPNTRVVYEFGASNPITYLILKYSLIIITIFSAINAFQDFMDNRRIEKLRMIDNHYQDKQDVIEELDKVQYAKKWRKTRKNTRFDVQGCYVHLRRRGFFIFGRKWLCGILDDLSMSGLSCSIFWDLNPGDKVSVLIDVPAFKNQLEASGIVLRSKRGNFGEHCIALKFVGIDDYTKGHIQALRKYDILRNAASIIGKKED